MDAIIELARKTPQDADMQAKLAEALNKAGKKHAGVVDKVLNEMLVNPVQHGVAYAELLAYKLHSSSPANEVKDPNGFFHQFRTLVNGIQPQELQYCGKAVTHVSRQLTKIVLGNNCGMMALGALKTLVEKITVAAQGVLTGVHVDLMLLVLKQHAYDLISDLSFLQGEFAILSLSPSQWPMESLDYLQFWLYLGNHHSACKDFVSAQEAYNMALTIPAQGAVSAIQVEAYKKFILVSLLAQGEVPPFNQRLTPSATVRYLESLAAPYLDLAKAYKKAAGASASSGGSSSQSVTGEMRHLTEINGEQFLADNNVGLIKQIMKALVKKQITKLTQTYITYSLADIAAHVQLGGDKHQGAAAASAPPQPAPALLAERYVFDMICANDVFAKLNSRAAMVRFLEDPEEYDTTPFIDAMDGRIKDVAGLSDKLAEIERDLQLTPAYIMRSGALGGGSGGGGRGDSDISFAKAISISEMEHGGRGRQSEEDDMEIAMRQSLMQQ